MSKNIKNIAASVHQLLLNKARASSRPFNEILQHYAIERLIYRLSKSHHADKFILKGALMFTVWCGGASRSTMDIDLLGKVENRLELISGVIKDVCEVKVEADGLNFNPETVRAERIIEDALYEGVRVRFKGDLGNAQITIQIDIGFGDVVVPRPEKIVYPTIFDFPKPEMYGYTKESVIAEKFEAMVKRGALNSLMKDFYDIWLLSKRFDFEGEVLAEAVLKTFENRKTPISSKCVLFEMDFGEDRDKKIQWSGFVNKAKVDIAPNDFIEVVRDIKNFIEPVIVHMVEKQDRPFRRRWSASSARWEKGVPVNLCS